LIDVFPNINLENEEITKQRISVAYCLDNDYTYPTLVSMISILENSSRYTFYTFYLLVEKNIFEKQNKEKFTHLEEKYDRCKVIIFELTNENLSNANTKRYPITTYYRLLLPKLIPDINRIIYLDGDTLVFSDLTEMINLEMNNNIILGFVDNSYKKAKQFGIKTNKYITCGVILINLKKMRKENISQKFFDFINKNKNKLTQEDQTVINIVLHGRIDFLPPKFGMWNFYNKKSLLKHNHYINKKLGIKVYNDSEFLKGWKHPSILHYVRKKPWNSIDNLRTKRFFCDKWWKYAKKSDEYKNILKFAGGEKSG
jgi:lipopolysaccharide biosynthesis glycosyltransferase